MALSLVPEAREQRQGNSLRDALETLHVVAMGGFTSGGIPALQAAWPVETGLDISSMVDLRNSVEQVILPALNAAIAGVPAPFNGDVGGQADQSISTLATAAVI